MRKILFKARRRGLDMPMGNSRGAKDALNNLTDLTLFLAAINVGEIFAARKMET